MQFRFYRIIAHLVFFSLFLLVSQYLNGAEASFPLPQSVKEASEALDWKGWFTIGVFIFTFLGLVTEVKPPDMTMLAGTAILLIFGILTPVQFLKGFSNDVLMTIAMLCVIVRAMEVNGVLEVIAKRVLVSSKSYTIQLLSMCTCLICFSFLK